MTRAILCLFLLFPLFAFTQTYEWAISFGGVEADNGNALVVDAGGHIYSTGVFQGTVDFDPGPGTVNLTSAVGGSAYVQKLDPLGNLVWARQLAGTGSSYGVDLALDGAGHLNLTGGFTGTVDFDPSASSFEFTTPGTFTNIFLWQLDTDGNFVWARHTPSAAIGAARALAVDAAGNIYSTGNFEGVIDFDAGVGMAILTSVGVRDAYVLKYDASGNFVWVSRIESTLVAEGTALAVDASGNAYVTGKFFNDADFDPGTGVLTLTATGDDDTFVLKLDASGNLAWVKQIGGNDYEHGRSIKLDGSSNIYVTGSFQDVVDFDPGAGTALLTSLGMDDIFVLKLDALGDFVWAKQVGSANNDTALALEIDVLGNVYTAGGFEGTVDFDPGAGMMDLTSSGSIDVYVQKLDPSGNLDWVKQVGGTGLDFALDLAVGASGKVYLTGLYSDTADLDPDGGVVNFTSLGGFDVFVLKLAAGPLSSIYTPPSYPLVVYPNPTHGSVQVLGSDINSNQLSVYNLLGQNLTSTVPITKQSQEQALLDLTNLSPGVYIVRTNRGIATLLKQ